MNLNLIQPLLSISPIDGRYHDKVKMLSSLFSEAAIMKKKLKIEILWFINLINEVCIIPEFKLSQDDLIYLRDLYENFNLEDAHIIKKIESRINHDTKAIEYFLKDKFSNRSQLVKYVEIIHLGCTSEDITNIAYTLSVKESLFKHIIPQILLIRDHLLYLSETYADLPMLSRTHGQPASPTTFGKEMANFSWRIHAQVKNIQNISLTAKINGAVGNHNALCVAFPKINWPLVAENFINSLELEYSPYTTQVESKDNLVRLFNELSLTNSVMIDLCQDAWLYISQDYLCLKPQKNHVGSSTMPHKVNPIDFENSEGNLKLANQTLNFMSQQLPISRLQRDLTDSTIMRNIGVLLSHVFIGHKSLLKGLNNVAPNEKKMLKDLNEHWEIISEAIQTIMRVHHIDSPYEKLKDLTRGSQLEKINILSFVDSLDLPKIVKKTLRNLTPEKYTGEACPLAKSIKRRLSI